MAHMGNLPQVIIVGAGIAGIAAARHLQKMGIPNVIVLEASQRVGGRIHTTDFNGEMIEMGANWIHGTENSPVMEIAQQHGLMRRSGVSTKVDRWQGSNKYFRLGGEEVSDEVATRVGSVFRKLLNDAQAIGARGSQIDPTVLSAAEKEGLGPFLRRGFSRYLTCSEEEREQEFSGLEVEAWDDDWAGAEAHAESGVSAVAFQNSVSASAGPAAGSLNSSCPGVTAGVSVESVTHSEPLKVGAVDPVVTDGSLQWELFRSRENLECCISAVDSLDDLSLRWLGEYEEYAGPHVTVPQGYSSVVKKMADDLLPNTIQFGQEVAQIQWSPDSLSEEEDMPVKVLTKGGMEWMANHVIVTVSLGVLKERCANCGPDAYPQNLFLPNLPEDKIDAIQRMGFGTVDKIFLGFPQPGVWGKDCLGMELVWKEASSMNGSLLQESKLPKWTRRLFAFHPVNASSNTVVSWISGKEAEEMENCQDDEVQDSCMQVMSSFLAEEKALMLGKSTSIKRSKWYKNPLFRGSYSYVSVMSSGEDILKLSEPVPAAAENSKSKPFQILFAGEATDRHSYSNTHGAFHSGCREAERLLMLYSSCLVKTS